MDSNGQDDMQIEPFGEPTGYELRVEGLLGQESTAWFEGLALEVDEETSPPQTVIRGFIRDQAALYGLISRIRDLGLLLVSVNQTGAKEETNGEIEGDKQA